jgi:hypothetical protein
MGEKLLSGMNEYSEYIENIRLMCLRTGTAPRMIRARVHSEQLEITMARTASAHLLACLAVGLTLSIPARAATIPAGFEESLVATCRRRRRWRSRPMDGC